jgi:hypothetical protein
MINTLAIKCDKLSDDWNFLPASLILKINSIIYNFKESKKTSNKNNVKKLQNKVFSGRKICSVCLDFIIVLFKINSAHSSNIIENEKPLID